VLLRDLLRQARDAAARKAGGFPVDERYAAPIVPSSRTRWFGEEHQPVILARSRGLLAFVPWQITPPDDHPLGGVTHVDGQVWIRDNKSLWKVVPNDAIGANRDFTLGWSFRPSIGRSVRWSDGKAGRPGRFLVVTFRYVDAGTPKLRCEVWRVLSDSGSVLGPSGGGLMQPEVVAAFEQVETQVISPATVDLAQNKWDDTVLLVSNSPFRVNVNPKPNWLTFTSNDDVFLGNAFMYDLENGTPADHYDFRAGILHNALTDPSPPRVATIYALKFVKMATYNPDDPASVKYAVYMRSYAVDDPVAAPLGLPKTATLTSVQGPPTGYSPSVQGVGFFNQKQVLTSMTARYDESTGKTLWVLRKLCKLITSARYDHTCTFHVTFYGDPAVNQSGIGGQPDHIRCGVVGLRLLVDGAVAYDDMPSGVVHLVRVNEEPFPSTGGYIALGNPAPTNFMRGTARVLSDTYQNADMGDQDFVHGVPVPLPDGTIWAVVSDSDRAFPKGSGPGTPVYYVVTASQQIGPLPMNYPDNRTEMYHLGVKGNRLWIVKDDNANTEKPITFTDV
jgi:hypothetical protein